NRGDAGASAQPEYTDRRPFGRCERSWRIKASATLGGGGVGSVGDLPVDSLARTVKVQHAGAAFDSRTARIEEKVERTLSKIINLVFALAAGGGLPENLAG